MSSRSMGLLERSDDVEDVTEGAPSQSIPQSYSLQLRLTQRNRRHTGFLHGKIWFSRMVEVYALGQGSI